MLEKIAGDKELKGDRRSQGPRRAEEEEEEDEQQYPKLQMGDKGKKGTRTVIGRGTFFGQASSPRRKEMGHGGQEVTFYKHQSERDSVGTTYTHSGAGLYPVNHSRLTCHHPVSHSSSQPVVQ